MNWFVGLLSSSLGKKLIMALTGLFLITFLAVHLIGNLQLLKDDGGHAFNVYAEFMSTNPLIQAVSKVNFAFILFHAIWGIYLTRKNRSARGSEGYVVTGKASPWASRNMALLGFLVLIFIVVHLKHFWAEMHFGAMPKVNYDGVEYRDIFSTVDYWFGVEWYVALYVACMAGLAFHLWHGFASAFQTLGLSHVKYTPVIQFIGRAFAILVPALFAGIPILMYLNIVF